MSQPHIIKKFRTIKKLKCPKVFDFEIHSEAIKRKWAKLLLDLIYVPTNNYQFISKLYGVKTCTRFWLWWWLPENQHSKSCHSCMQHSYLTFCLSLQKIISNCMGIMTWARFWLQGRYCCMQHAYWSLFIMPLPNILKIFQTIKNIWSAQ